MTAPSSARRVLPPLGATSSPGSVNGRQAYATAPMTASANGTPIHCTQSQSSEETELLP